VSSVHHGVARPDFVLNGFFLSVGFRTNGVRGNTSRKGHQNQKGSRQPGAAAECYGGILAIYVQYNGVCAYTHPVSSSSYGLGCACFCEGFLFGVYLMLIWFINLEFDIGYWLLLAIGCCSTQ
jgi:hypothetical protein